MYYHIRLVFFMFLEAHMFYYIFAKIQNIQRKWKTTPWNKNSRNELNGKFEMSHIHIKHKFLITWRIWLSQWVTYIVVNWISSWHYTITMKMKLINLITIHIKHKFLITWRIWLRQWVTLLTEFPLGTTQLQWRWS